MKKSFIALLLFTTSLSFASDRCTPQEVDQDILVEQDFPWNQTLEDLKKNGEEFYKSNKRLNNRAYKNQKGQFVIPLKVSSGIKDVKITPLFIKSVTLHVEEAFKRTYIDALHFGDMGHSHFFVPQKYYDEVLDQIPVANFDLLYEKMLSHKELRILYHTAEQLIMRTPEGELHPDRHVQWRFFTRNLVGDNMGLGRMELLHKADHKYNTADHESYSSGYRYWGGGFYISAHEKGCFPFNLNGKTMYFDLNLSGINPKSEF